MATDTQLGPLAPRVAADLGNSSFCLHVAAVDTSGQGRRTTRLSGGDLGVFQQHVVLELFTVLLDALAHTASAPAVLNDSTDPPNVEYNGPASLSTEMCDVSYTFQSGCYSPNTRTTERNLSLYLDESTTSLEQALARYVAAETIEGYAVDEEPGQRYCDEGTALHHCPTLTIQLATLHFDWERQRRVKVDQLCAFPVTMDMVCL